MDQFGFDYKGTLGTDKMGSSKIRVRNVDESPLPSEIGRFQTPYTIPGFENSFSKIQQEFGLRSKVSD